jgi:predicted DNA-binding transcriptional regulator YafY
MCRVRLSRCLRLLTLLQSRIGYSTSELAHQCEVSKRTIYRDLRLLAASGIPVRYDSKKQGHIVAACSDVCMPELSSDRLVALLLAAHIFSLSCDEDISRPIHQAIGTLLSRAPLALREEVAGLLKSIGGKPSAIGWPQGSRPIVGDILTALRQKRQIRIVYYSPTELGVQTKITPRQLVAAQGKWYLVGRSSWHRKVRRFDMSHIREAELLENTFKPEESPLRHARIRS